MTWPCPSLKLKGPRPREESNIVPLQESGIMHRQLLKLVKRTYKSQLTVSPERDLRVQSCGLDLTSTFNEGGGSLTFCSLTFLLAFRSAQADMARRTNTRHTSKTVLPLIFLCWLTSKVKPGKEKQSNRTCFWFVYNNLWASLADNNSCLGRPLIF